MSKRTIAVILRAEIDQYKRAMSDAAKSTEEIGEKSKKTSKDGIESAKKFGDGWAAVGTPLMAAGGAVTALGASMLKTGISYNTLQQQSRAALTTLLGSAEAANAQMDKLDQFARNSPFAKQTFITAQQQMLAFGIETQKVIPYLDAVQNAVAAAGGSNQELADITRIMSQIHASSKITAMDLREFGNRGLDAATIIGESMGKTGAQIRSEITAGTLGADVALDALAQGMEAKFGGAADGVKNTFLGAMDRVSAAWRDLSASLAEPLVGKEGGGLGVFALNELADAIRAVEGLPGPVKVAGGAVAGLAGATMLASGAFLTFAPRIVATREAVSKLSPGMQAAYGHTTRLAAGIGKATAAAIAFYAVLEAREATLGRMDNSAPGVEATTAALFKLADGSDAALNSIGSLNTNWGKVGFGGLFGLLDSWGTTDIAGTFDKADSAIGNFFGKIPGYVSSSERAGEVVANIDAALAAAVQQGNPEKAAEMFSALAEATNRTELELKQSLPAYQEALIALGNEANYAAEGVGTLAGALKLTEPEFEELIKSAEAQARAFIGLGDSVTDTKVSMGDWIKQMEEQNKALRDFTANAESAARRGLDEGLIASLRELGPEGAFRMKQLANATDEEIARANAAYRDGETAAGEYRDSIITLAAELLDVPERVITELLAEDKASGPIGEVGSKLDGLDVEYAEPTIGVNDQATPVLRSIRNYLSSMRTMALEIPVRGGGGGGGGSWANGGLVEYADGGISSFGNLVPRVPQLRQASQGAVMWGEPETGWEAYISGKPGMEERNRQILALAAQRLGMMTASFAGGGFAQRSRMTAPTLGASVGQFSRPASSPAASSAPLGPIDLSAGSIAAVARVVSANIRSGMDYREFENATPVSVLGGLE